MSTETSLCVSSISECSTADDADLQLSPAVVAAASQTVLFPFVPVISLLSPTCGKTFYSQCCLTHVELKKNKKSTNI